MPGTKEGAMKARERNLAKDPDFYKKIGSQSWKDPNRNRNVGFALLPEEERRAHGKKGGQTKKRTTTETRKTNSGASQ